MSSIQSVPELYAHAIAIEREAAARYTELAQQMADRDGKAAAEVFAMLARIEAEHLETLERRTDGIALPSIPAGQYQWLDAGAPEAAAHEWLFRVMTPRQALKIALEAEKRAVSFFEGVFLTAADPGIHALAHEMVLEEKEHVALVKYMLERTPDPVIDWASIYETEFQQVEGRHVQTHSDSDRRLGNRRKGGERRH